MVFSYLILHSNQLYISYYLDELRCKATTFFVNVRVACMILGNADIPETIGS